MLLKEFIVEPASAFKFNVIHYIQDTWKSFKELSEKYEEINKENIRLKTTLNSLAIELARQLALEPIEILNKIIKNEFEVKENEGETQ